MLKLRLKVFDIGLDVYQAQRKFGAAKLSITNVGNTLEDIGSMAGSSMAVKTQVNDEHEDK